jgi:hypothetical protein
MSYVPGVSPCRPGLQCAGQQGSDVPPVAPCRTDSRQFRGVLFPNPFPILRSAPLSSRLIRGPGLPNPRQGEVGVTSGVSRFVVSGSPPLSARTIPPGAMCPPASHARGAVDIDREGTMGRGRGPVHRGGDRLRLTWGRRTPTPASGSASVLLRAGIPKPAADEC